MEVVDQMTTAIVIILIILAAALFFYLMRAGLQKGLRQVVEAFREHRALDAKRARTPEELGLMPTHTSFIGGLFRLRDYRPQAMRLLGEEKIVFRTPDGKRFWLDEGALAASRLKTSAKL